MPPRSSSADPAQLIDATLVGAALANAADRAYASVREPAEGTILTVAREMAHKIVTDVAHSSENPRLGPATDEQTQDGVIADALERAVEAGQDSVRRGPSCWPRCARPGVVDAGGYGLTIIMAGVVAALRGDRRRSSNTTRRRASAIPSTAPSATATARTSPSPAATSAPAASSRRWSASATRCWSWATRRR